VYLAFVVGSAAAKEITVADGGIKSGRSPEVKRFGGLHIIVSVEKDRRLTGCLEGLRINQGMKVRGDDLNRFKSRGSELGGDPAGGAFNVGLVLALGTDAGDAQKFAQFRKVLITATFYIFCKVYIRPQGCESFPV
jgi:hypothetical protein